MSACGHPLVAGKLKARFSKCLCCGLVIMRKKTKKES